jgi:hypothetical protein
LSRDQRKGFSLLWKRYANTAEPILITRDLRETQYQRPLLHPTSGRAKRNGRCAAPARSLLFFTVTKDTQNSFRNNILFGEYCSRNGKMISTSGKLQHVSRHGVWYYMKCSSLRPLTQW